jgi:hypothetical protein
MSLFALLWDANVQERKMAVSLEEQVMSALAGPLLGLSVPRIYWTDIEG